MAGNDIDPWKSWTGNDCHPDAPAGGGGPGQFRRAGSTCAWAGALAPSLLAPPQIDRVIGHAGSTLPVPASSVAAGFGVRDIPAVMRDALGWPRSAAVMDLWFSRPGRAMSVAEKQDGDLGPAFPAAFRDDKLFTMQWLLSFKRVDTALQQLKAALDTANARQVLASIAQGLPDGPGSAAGLGVASLHAQHQFQLAQVGYDGEMDDLYGSLGRFGLYAAMLEWQIGGGAAPAKRQLQVSKVGLYMRDTFDFIGGQYLGHWNRQGMGMVPGAVLAGKISADAEWSLPAWNINLGWMTAINNAQFNAWRDQRQTGGDLLLFSDVVAHQVDIRVAL